MNFKFQVDNKSIDPYERWGIFFADGKTLALQEASIFIYETPVSIVATAVAGVALSIFFTSLGSICLGIVLGSTMSRIAIKIIDHYNSHYLIDLKSKAIETNNKYPKLWMIGYLFATCVSSISPGAGLAISLCYGAFKGIIIQVDVYKYNQELLNKMNSTYNI